MTDVIERRAALVAGLPGRYSLLVAARAAALFTEIRDLVQQEARGLNGAATTFDGSNADRDEVIAWAKSLNLGNPVVEVFWLADRAGLAMRLDDFIEHYDDLWFPGADDVWIVDAAREWMLEIDHEEQLTLRRCTLPATN